MCEVLSDSLGNFGHIASDTLQCVGGGPLCSVTDPVLSYCVVSLFSVSVQIGVVTRVSLLFVRPSLSQVHGTEFLVIS
jgi:hypothetical protein